MKLLLFLVLCFILIFPACSEKGKTKKLDQEQVVDETDSLNDKGELLFNCDCKSDGYNVHISKKGDVFNVFSTEGDNEWFLFNTTECVVRNIIYESSPNEFGKQYKFNDQMGNSVYFSEYGARQVSPFIRDAGYLLSLDDENIILSFKCDSNPDFGYITPKGCKTLKDSIHKIVANSNVIVAQWTDVYMDEYGSTFVFKTKSGEKISFSEMDLGFNVFGEDSPYLIDLS